MNRLLLLLAVVVVASVAALARPERANAWCDGGFSACLGAAQQVWGNYNNNLLGGGGSWYQAM
jgi:hypothetical protein